MVLFLNRNALALDSPGRDVPPDPWPEKSLCAAGCLLQAWWNYTRSEPWQAYVRAAQGWVDDARKEQARRDAIRATYR
jgi:hypothetical protein